VRVEKNKSIVASVLWYHVLWVLTIKLHGSIMKAYEPV
jgi:hypothetical protein